MGRPLQFDRETAMLKAMQYFWERGYGATSMSELSEAMDMRPGSIYAAFGSKRELLFETINFYATTGQTKVKEILEHGTVVKDQVEVVLKLMIDEMSCQKVAHGCLLVNLLLELGSIDDEARVLVQKHLRKMKGIFQKALRRAQENGEIPPEKDLSVQATFLMGSVYSLRIMARAGASLKELRTMKSETLRHIFDS